MTKVRNVNRKIWWKQIWRVVWSYDTLLACCALFVSIRCFDSEVSIERDIEMLSVHLTFFSILFAACIAVLVFIISSSSSEFATYMEEKNNAFSNLLFNFKVTVVSMLVTILISTVMYVISIHDRDMLETVNHSRYCITFVFVASTYSTIALLQSIFDIFRFARYGVMFKMQRSGDSEQKDNSN